MSTAPETRAAPAGTTSETYAASTTGTAATPTAVPPSFAALRGQLHTAAEEFAGGPDALEGILLGMVDDVDRAVREPLEIFPVCHHSPASALAMARRLREKRPKVVYLELCEDMAPLLTELRTCRLPVAVQAFASDIDGFPSDWAPLSVVAPITEASAEYQAVAYALGTPGVELVLVDRSSDHVFQWDARRPAGDDQEEGTGEDGAALHGEAVGVEIGDLRPRFAELEEHLLRHGKVRHWSEWWHQYVEVPLGDGDHDTYRQVMFLIGSLFRRLAPGDGDRLRVDEDRERYMWTRMREHLAATGTDPADCLYVCGAFHAASRVEEFGVHGADGFAISPRTATTWQYGLIPSSHAAIETQFGLATGSVSIAAAQWTKNLARTRVQPYRLEGQAGTRKGSAKTPAKTPAEALADKTAAPVAIPDQDPGPDPGPDPAGDRLSGFLRRPPVLDTLDEAELLGWSVDVVRAARRSGYLASTADAIAVFETSILLAGMRDRAKPTPYDFQDAAVTCIEKDAVPGRRDVRRIVEIMMGGDRIGQVGYEALPPLARDVHDRLAPLEPDLQQRGVRRALLDMTSRPELRACSDVLWMLRRLLPAGAARPVMGERRLGERSVQESWDLALGTHQRALIELGYEGVSLEQVLEQRLRRTAHGPRVTTAGVLAAVEDATLYLGGRRLADELGTRALEVLAGERTVDGAPEVLRRVRGLLAYYRTAEPVLPPWIESFVRTGYAHYCTLLPTTFQDEDATTGQVAAMLGFLFGMEGLALSLGCDRTQLELAVAQSRPKDPAKTALLWAARVRLGTLSREELRARCDELLASPLVVPSYPRYLSGFVHALEPVPGLADVVVEAVSNAFGRLPDAVLLPWLPVLVTTLRANAGDLAPLLVREAGRTFPARLADLDAWIPPWRRPPAAPRAARPGPASAALRGVALLPAHPATCDALAELLGCTEEWAPAGGPPPGTAGAALLSAHPDTCDAPARLLGCDEPWAPADAVLRPPSLTDRHPATAHAVAALLAER
ncbi:hypothetical protein ACFYNX_00600 [Streptomyces sp. NPDC007872]|uniref:hypothetical protein n=1 Tax=Streptomyces sp. NPDC007872 TaxID=3364782 RepID=UPI0036BA0309